jgi:hypothetical protein
MFDRRFASLWIVLVVVAAVAQVGRVQPPAPAVEAPAGRSMAEPVPALDATVWFEQLTQARPGLMKQHTGGIKDPAWQALVIRPRYRNELLNGSGATYETIVARDLVPDLEDADATWAEDLRLAQLALVPSDTLYPSGYPIQAYVGFRTGTRGPWNKDRGLSYKTFFEVDDLHTTLSPDRVVGFARELERVGFVGDFKIDLRRGQVRFQYNNVIVHAPTMAMAECAEATGLRWFAGQLLHVAHGLDVVTTSGPLDWHHFLLTGKFHELPEDVQAFARHQTPHPTSTCPGPRLEAL